MPLKEFQCEACKLEFETLFRPNRDEEIECPKCGGQELQPVISSHAGYAIRGSNNGSTRPRNSGSFKRSKNE